MVNLILLVLLVPPFLITIFVTGVVWELVSPHSIHHFTGGLSWVWRTSSHRLASLRQLGF